MAFVRSHPKEQPDFESGRRDIVVAHSSVVRRSGGVFARFDDVAGFLGDVRSGAVRFFDEDVDTSAPKVLGAVALSPTRVQVGFSEPMNQTGEFLSPGSYVVDDPLTSVLAAQAFGTHAVILTVSEMGEDVSYVVTVATTLLDLEGNNLDANARTALFLGAGTSPFLVSVDVVNDTRLRLNFSESLKDDAALRATASYLVTPTGNGPPIFVGEVDPENQEQPQFVDLLVTEGLAGAGYQAQVVGQLIDPVGNVIVSPTSQPFVATATPPDFFVLEAVSLNRVDVVFTEPILDNTFARDSSKYLWDNGLTTISVLDIEGNRVKLVTSDQDPDLLYTLTVTP